ncbi:hypothetical protein LB452_13365 [Psychroflexus sp. CAK8W]|uniref:Uncharacterized protein n=1 Tax=Psychroflexus longus TaxID=2873596 RepID=A0ABS7XLP4_9FLAO|nr:hypothetical protein [Psychroflexus longus]MBZ9779909.1 hypothetical protein [Psychroflexus longus]
MRKKIVLIFGIIILQLNFSCKSQYSATELNKNFTSVQIADLNKITEFFKSEMCLHMDSDFKTCYERTPHEYLEATGNPFWKEIDFEKQKELYNQISPTTFNEIWTFCKSINLKTGFEYRSVCPIYNGKYQKYLADLGENDERIEKYLKRIQNYGDFNYFDIGYREILNNRKHFDLKDPNFQLILAIHYLSLNDIEKRKEKWVTE